MRIFKLRTQSQKTGNVSAYRECKWMQITDQFETITIDRHPTDPDLLRIQFEDAQRIFIFNTDMLRELLDRAATEGSKHLDFTVYNKR